MLANPIKPYAVVSKENGAIKLNGERFIECVGRNFSDFDRF